MIGPIVLVCKWKANSSKELDGQPRAGNQVLTIFHSQFSRSLQQLVMSTTQELGYLHSGISTRQH